MKIASISKMILELEKRNDVAFFTYFYAICVNSGYQEALPRIEEYIGTIGRMLYILPTIRAMTMNDWSRGYVRPLFERVRDAPSPDHDQCH